MSAARNARRLAARNDKFYPNAALAHYNRGLALQMRKQRDDALASYDRAIAIKADFFEAHCNRGVVLNELMQQEAALASYDRAIALKPRDAETYLNRARVLYELNRTEKALQDIDRAIALNPDSSVAHCARGAVLNLMHSWEAALPCYDRAIALDPACARAYMHRGYALAALGRLDGALASYDRAIALDPEFVRARGYRSSIRLTLGDFARGLPDLEYVRSRSPVVFKQPLWLGAEPLTGKTVLLLHCEPGLGDTIQFCRYASKVAALGARVILMVPARLKNLLTGLEGVCDLIVEGEPLPEFDYYCPLWSLPLAFGTTLATIPAEVPYLKAHKALSWKERLGQSSKLRVGLVWAIGFRPERPASWSLSSLRNISLAKLVAALEHPAIEFYSLQKGEQAEAELAALKARDSTQIIDLPQQDFSDTAALIEQLDLVISVDTSVAHCAGALGKRTWLLLPFASADWRWLLERTDSPWYPSFKLYRQAQMGDWSAPLTRLSADLRAWVCAERAATG